MVKIDNKPDTIDTDNPNPDNDSHNKNESNKEVKRYQVDERELTFGIDGIKNAKVVASANDIPDGKTEANYLDKKVLPAGTPAPPAKTAKELRMEKLERLSYDDQNIKFIHLPDDPAYRPISIELIKMNEFENEDLRLNTRIMMNIALSDYVIFRVIDDEGNLDNVQKYFKRVKTNEFQEYVDLQTELDDLVRRVGIIEATVPFTLELQDKLYDYQKKLIDVARKRVRKGFDIFFKWSDAKERDQVFEDADNNDITFNVDCAFIRITKSPFLRRKSSPSS